MNEILQKSSRDLDRARADLTAWLAGRLPAGSAPAVTELTAPPTGQSSETLLFTATWDEEGARRVRRLVARVAPRQVDMPIFPSYQMGREFQVIQLVGEPLASRCPRRSGSRPTRLRSARRSTS